MFFFFFNDTATTEIYTLSLHDALPIYLGQWGRRRGLPDHPLLLGLGGDRKSTRLNSSHGYISYAVFCLKKKKKQSKIEEVVVDGLGTRTTTLGATGDQVDGQRSAPRRY